MDRARNVIHLLSNIKGKHSTYLQVVLNNEVINEYMALFLNSQLGKLILLHASRGVVASSLAKKDLESSLVFLPPIAVQRNIVETNTKLRELREAIDLFGAELAINPSNSKIADNQIDNMLAAMNSFTDADKVSSLIREGESKTVEFKESLSLDVKTQKREKYIEKAALKTVVAFLNTDGGSLLIGVSDEGVVKGLDLEIEQFHKNSDKFLLHFRNLLKDKVGSSFYSSVEYKLVEVEGRTVLLVECDLSQSPCFLIPSKGQEEFYVRTNPATDKLEGSRLIRYIQTRFNQS